MHPSPRTNLKAPIPRVNLSATILMSVKQEAQDFAQAQERSLSWVVEKALESYLRGPASQDQP